MITKLFRCILALKLNHHYSAFRKTINKKKCRTQEEHVSHASLRFLVPQANINTYFSLRTKWCLRGGVGGQFRRNLNWSFHTDLSIRWLWVFNFSNDRWFEKEIFRYKSAFQAHRQTVQNAFSEESRFGWRFSRSGITSKSFYNMALVFGFPSYYPTYR